jgi:hypothetical protein
MFRTTLTMKISTVLKILTIIDDKHDIDDTKYELNLLEVATLIITNDNNLS